MSETKTLERLNRLKTLVNSLLAEIESLKKALTKKKTLKGDPLLGLLKGAKISNQDIKKAKHIFNYYFKDDK